MNLTKHYEYFNPTTIEEPIHIIGCGAIGSTLAENLVRLGLTNIHLYDFDTVAEHNIANQMFRQKDIGWLKVIALEEILKEINPHVDITKHEEGYTNRPIKTGYIFLCVDNIELRKKIVEEHRYNPNIKAFFDFRMGLADAQHYATLNTPTGVSNLLKTMDFTHTEAKQNMPISACGTSLNILPTVRIIVANGVANFINYVKTNNLKHTILIDAFAHQTIIF